MLFLLSVDILLIRYFKHFRYQIEGSKTYVSMISFVSQAQVVKLVDTRDLKSLEGNFVPVQVRPWAPLYR